MALPFFHYCFLFSVFFPILAFSLFLPDRYCLLFCSFLFIGKASLAPHKPSAGGGIKQRARRSSASGPQILQLRTVQDLCISCDSIDSSSHSRSGVRGKPAQFLARSDRRRVRFIVRDDAVCKHLRARSFRALLPYPHPFAVSPIIRTEKAHFLPS